MARKLFWTLVLALATLTLPGCGGSETQSAIQSLSARTVTLPDGGIVQAEVALRPDELMRGLKYRESLAPDRGMVFIHNEEGLYPYWMFECKIALDMIWMDRSKRIVEIAANVRPCPGAAETCPSYGGHQQAMFVLELASGQAARHDLQKGQIIEF